MKPVYLWANISSNAYLLSLQNGDKEIEILYSQKDDDRISSFGKSTFQFNVSFVVLKTISCVCSKEKLSLLKDCKFYLPTSSFSPPSISINFNKTIQVVIHTSKVRKCFVEKIYVSFSVKFVVSI